jgi:nicotinamidase/pyrazinamidase
MLRERGLRHVYCCGLATDFCVAFSAVDAAIAGFDTVVIDDACRAIDSGGSLAAARRDMANAGVRIVTSADL